jgi:hypothetical protein
MVIDGRLVVDDQSNGRSVILRLRRADGDDAITDQ